MGLGIKRITATPIAVDFGVGCLRVAQLDGTDKPSLTAWAEIPTPEDLYDKDAERLAFQADALRTTIGSGPFKGKRAICSVPAMQTIAQSVQVQRTGPTTTSAVLEQLARASGVEPFGLIARWHEVAEVTRGGNKCAEVMCLAMHRDNVTNHMRAIRGAKLEPVGIHCEHSAMMRSFDRVTRREADESLLSLFVDLGFGSTKLVVAEGRELLLAKTIPVGGLTFDRELAERWGCTPAEAHARRMASVEEFSSTADLSQDKPVDRPHPEAADASDASSEGSPFLRAMRKAPNPQTKEERRMGATPPGVRGIGEPGSAASQSSDNAPANSVSIMTDEISMFLRYFRALVPGREIGRAIFVGGQARDIALCRRVAKSIRIATHVADPMAWVQRPEHESSLAGPQPGWAVALGLCVSKADL